MVSKLKSNYKLSALAVLVLFSRIRPLAKA